MALIKCLECSNEVSDTAFKCPKCGAQIRTPKRGFFGKIFKWSFIGFNILMVLWLVIYFGIVGDMNTASTNDTEKAGVAIGATIGTGFVLSFWVAGDIILGLLVLFTRPRS